MASTRYLVFRYAQLRAKLKASCLPGYVDSVFTEADDAEMTRIFNALSGERYEEVVFEPGHFGGIDQAEVRLR